jgi:hypothetical protein
LQLAHVRARGCDWVVFDWFAFLLFLDANLTLAIKSVRIVLKCFWWLAVSFMFLSYMCMCVGQKTSVKSALKCYWWLAVSFMFLLYMCVCVCSAISCFNGKGIWSTKWTSSSIEFKRQKLLSC